MFKLPLNSSDGARPTMRPAGGAPGDASRADAPTAADEGARRRSKRRAPFLVRLANAWWNRLIGAVYEGSLADQEAEYLEHETGRDYLWNSIGTGLWGVTFPALTVVATQLAGTEQAGRLSMAFAAGTLLMIISNFGVRTFQASDVDGQASFASYQVHRWITSLIALVVGLLYCTLRDYAPAMFTISMGIYVYKVVDGLADVYEGRLQQADKLYLAGISQALRSAAVIAAFTVVLFLTRTLAFACVAAGAAAIATLVLVSIPLALLETDKSDPWQIPETAALFRHCFPLFFSLFMFNLIDAMPKFAMESLLSYDNQLFFNALYFPAQGITITSGFIYKPQLLRLADIWSNPRRRKRFDLIVVAMFALIAGVTVFTGVFMGWIGIPLMSFMYGVDFEQYRALAYAMVAAGGVNATVDFIYAVVTVLRHQDAIVAPSLITFACACVVPTALIHLFGLGGAVAGYLVVMVVLAVLLAIEYARVRRAIASDKRSPFD